MLVMTPALPLERLKAAFGKRLELNAPLARLTSARIGGPAEALLTVKSAGELAEAVQLLWEADTPYIILGGGSNVLVSDEGVRGVVVLNKASQVRFDEYEGHPSAWAESGANFGVIARQAAQKGYTGLEWAAGIPGTLGGAIFGNAGAHGDDVAGQLLLAEILHRDSGRQAWPVERLGYGYRTSALKREPGAAVVLAARLGLETGEPEAIQAKLDEYLAFRRRTQPPGASMGSMFKNPPDDYAGRLIEAAGLKGKQLGAAQISPLHGNFFLNLGGARAEDVLALIEMARAKVAEKFGIELELEVELVGEWRK